MRILTVCDSGTKFLIDALPRLDEKTKTDSMALAEFYVKSLTVNQPGDATDIALIKQDSTITCTKGE
nr:unnamed protein product [Callosobruchus chinensis]